MAKHSNQPPTELSAALHACRRAMLYVFIFSFAVNILSLLQPLYSMQVFDRVFTTRSVDTLIGLTAVIIIGYIFYGALYAIRAGVIARVVEWMERTVAPKLLRISIEQAAQTGAPYAGQHQRDLATIKNFIALATPTAMDIPWSLMFVIVIYMINPILGFLAVIGVILLCLSALINEYVTRKSLMRATEKNVESTLGADAIGRSAEAICAMGMNDAVVNNWEADTKRGLELQDLAQQRSAIINGITRSMRMLLQVSVIAIGAYLCLQNQLSAGGLIAASILVQRTLSPFDSAINIWKQLVGARDAYHRLTLLMRNVVPPVGSTLLPAPKGRLTVEGLYLGFGKLSQPVLRNINFELQPGESLGIIGPSAAGKSTLAKALAGVFLPTMGTVRLDGAELFRWGRAEVGQYIGYLPQQVDLFAGTLKFNIARLLPDTPDAKIIEAAQKAGVHNMILQFENGYDTVYVPGNTVLSPGQKQRIGLARAMFGTPRLVIMDEPNSNLDGEGERALMHTIAQLKQAGITTIIVAHRPSVLAGVDKILVLKNGAVDAIGPRDEILGRFSPAAPRRIEGGAA
ncbi:MAG: type I secretion system permease/ATPase [Rickettsiales bacterium]